VDASVRTTLAAARPFIALDLDVLTPDDDFDVLAQPRRGPPGGPG
jgi:hypothetical protein